MAAPPSARAEADTVDAAALDRVSHVNPALVDVLVVGAGPSGCAAAIKLCDQGHSVVMVERALWPRDTPCGDVLTPAAITLLDHLEIPLHDAHLTSGLRLSGAGRTIDLPWPRIDHPTSGQALTLSRRVLDERLADRAVAGGTEFRTQTSADEPLLEDGLLRGAQVSGPNQVTETIRARFVVIADGSLSHFGRALGTARVRTHAQAIARRGYFRTEQDDLPWLEIDLGPRAANGDCLPGYRWAFPMGHGLVNVGVGVLSSSRNVEQLDPGQLLQAWVEELPRHWHIDTTSCVGEPNGGRVPLGGSISPRSGPNWLCVGDAGGNANPFKGDGVEAALRTGVMAGEAIDRALRIGDGLALRHFDRALEQRHARSFKMARFLGRAASRPTVMHRMTQLVMHSQPTRDWLFRVANDDMDPESRAQGKRTYRLLERLAGLIPER